MSKGIKQTLKDALDAIRHDLGNEFTYALDDIRQKVVEEPWFGRSVTPEAVDFYRWLGPTPGEAGKSPDAGKGDVPGRAVDAPEVDDHMPPEGRPSNLEERMATMEAYARHQAAGPLGTIEMENAHSYEWREFEEWLDKEEPQPAGGGGITLDIEAEQKEEAEIEI